LDLEGSKHRAFSPRPADSGKAAVETRPASDTDTDTDAGKAVVKQEFPDRKPRTNYKANLPSATLKEVDSRISGSAPTDADIHDFNEWLKNDVYPAHPDWTVALYKKNMPKSVYLLGKTLTPPKGLVLSETPCDYCQNRCPYRCMVMDQGTSCFVCNYLRRAGCTRNGGNKVCSFLSRLTS